MTPLQSIGQPKIIKRLDVKQAAFQCGMKPQDLYNARSQGRDGGFIQWDYADKFLYVLASDVDAFKTYLDAHKAGAVKRIGTKNQAAVELGRRGGKKGGIARAIALSPERRTEIAEGAAKARWAKSPRGTRKRIVNDKVGLLKSFNVLDGAVSIPESAPKPLQWIDVAAYLAKKGHDTAALDVLKEKVAHE